MLHSELVTGNDLGGMSPRRSLVKQDVTVLPQAVPSFTEQIQAIDWYQFEKLITALFEAEGHDVVRRGGAHPDGGVDLMVDSEHGKTLVQCKHWKAWNVGVRHVRELMGAMMDANVPSAILITLRGYTAEAKALAAQHGIVLLSASDVVQMIDEVQAEKRAELLLLLNPAEKRCPKCEGAMVLRTARKGEHPGQQFWGCANFPKCRYVIRH